MREVVLLKREKMALKYRHSFEYRTHVVFAILKVSLENSNDLFSIGHIQKA